MRKLSILGDSISTYAGVSSGVGVKNQTTVNNRDFFGTGIYDVSLEDTWWMRAAHALQMEILVDNAYSGSCLLYERLDSMPAYMERCVNLHSDDGEEPDVIAVYMGTNDYWFFPDTLGSADAICYEKLICETVEGCQYATPTTSCEAYAIVLHKMKKRYPNAKIYCFTLLANMEYGEHSLEVLEQFNDSVKTIAKHFAVGVVDLYGTIGPKADEKFLSYMADDLHPSPAGMEAISQCFVKENLL